MGSAFPSLSDFKENSKSIVIRVVSTVSFLTDSCYTLISFIFVLAVVVDFSLE